MSRDPDGRAGAAISLRGLTKKFGDDTVVNGIDLDVEPGEFLVLLGPSGSGKTTTLNMIAGFTPISSGQLLLNGVAAQDVPPHKRDIGMVFQNYALFPHMSVHANVAYPLRQRKIGKSVRNGLVAEALETVGLGSLGSRKPSELSGGQQQRVALARAMVYGPGVLLMDEPLGALDKKLRDGLQLEIRRIHADLGTTFVYVTHDQDEALVLADRIAVFRDGRIEQLGTARQLYETPSSLFVGQFLGESSVLHGTASPSERGTRVATCGTTVQALKGEAISTGDVIVFLRPEMLRIVSKTAATVDAQGVSGTVTEEVFLGNARRLSVALVDGSSIVVRESADRLSDCTVGAPVLVTFRPQDATALRPVADERLLAAERSPQIGDAASDAEASQVPPVGEGAERWH